MPDGRPTFSTPLIVSPRTTGPWTYTSLQERELHAATAHPHKAAGKNAMLLVAEFSLRHPQIVESKAQYGTYTCTSFAIPSLKYSWYHPTNLSMPTFNGVVGL